MQGFHEIVLLVGKIVLGSGSQPPPGGRGSKKVPRAERKAQGAVDTTRLAREAQVGYGILGTVLSLVIVAFAAQAGVGSGPARLTALKPSSKELQQALFGGTPWLIECLGKRREEPSAALLEARSRSMLPSSLTVATLDCDAALPNGQSTVERLKLSASDSGPLTLLTASASSVAPTLVGKAHVRSAEALARYVKGALTPQFVLANSTLDLHRFCLRRKRCLLLLSMGAHASRTSLRPFVCLSSRTKRFCAHDLRITGGATRCQARTLPDWAYVGRDQPTQSRGATPHHAAPRHTTLRRTMPRPAPPSHACHH